GRRHSHLSIHSRAEMSLRADMPEMEPFDDALNAFLPEEQTEKPRNAGHHADVRNDSPSDPAPTLRLRLEPTDHDLPLKHIEDRHVPPPIVVPAPTVQKGAYRSRFVTGIMTALSVSVAIVLLVVVVQHFEPVDGSSPVAALPERTAVPKAPGVGGY